MNTSKKAIALAIGGALVASIATTNVSAATSNPFALKSLTSGYMVADAKDMQDGKCGAGKCGVEKATEASCHADKAKEASCHADKAMEGSCHADKTKEAACNAKK